MRKRTRLSLLIALLAFFGLMAAACSDDSDSGSDSSSDGAGESSGAPCHG